MGGSGAKVTITPDPAAMHSRDPVEMITAGARGQIGASRAGPDHSQV